MRCKHVKEIIADVREDSENLDVDQEFGISDGTFLRHINHAIKRIHAMISNKAPELFHKVHEVNLQPDQAVVELPRDIFNTAKIADVKFRLGTSDDRDTSLRRSWKKLDTYIGRTGIFFPVGYYIEGDTLRLYPRPSSGGILTVTYVVRPPKVALSVGTVSDGLDLPKDTAALTAIRNERGCCVIDKDGGIVASLKIGVEITETLDFIDEGVKESLTAGYEVVPGVLASTHPDLDDYFERYLEEFCHAKITLREASAQYQQIDSWRSLIEKEIEMTYSAVTADYIEIPDYDSVSNEEGDVFD